MDVRQWDLWWAQFRFEESNETKDRPVLIISIADHLYVLGAKIISHALRDMWGEYEIIDWNSAGLPHPSTVRLNQIIKIEEPYILDFAVQDATKRIKSSSFAALTPRL